MAECKCHLTGLAEDWVFCPECGERLKEEKPACRPVTVEGKISRYCPVCQKDRSFIYFADGQPFRDPNFCPKCGSTLLK